MENRMHLRAGFLLISSLILFSGLFFGTSWTNLLYASEEVFTSFEEEAEIDDATPSSGVRIAQSDRFPAWREKSLEAVFPKSGGSIRFSKIPSDWGHQRALLFFVWSEQKTRLTLTLHDSTSETFSKSFALQAGVNHLQLPFSQIRHINLRHMESFTLKTDQSGTFYLDYFALDRFHPVLEQRGRWDVEYSVEIESDHIPWARPFAGKSIQCYALTDVANGRGIVELAQRLQMEFVAATIGRRSSMEKWGFGDFYGHRSPPGRGEGSYFGLAHAYIAHDLIYGPEYDVILWPGIHPWESYPQPVRDAIRKRVANGTGLVLFYPSAQKTKSLKVWSPSPWILNDDLAGSRDSQSSSMGERRERRFRQSDHSPWHPTCDHYITRGVPFDTFPWGQLSVARYDATGQVLLATADGAPVLAVQTFGKGRVVAFAYHEQGLIPAVHQVFETGLSYNYQEYLWSLVARSVAWAAKAEPRAAIQSVTPNESGVTVTLENPPAGATVRAAVRNTFGETESVVSASVVQGANSLRLDFAAPLQGGQHFADVRLLQAERAHDWATVSFDVPAKVVLHAVELEVDRVRLGQEISVRIELSSTEKIKCTMEARLFDNYDRLLDEYVQDVSLQGTKAQGATVRTVRLKTDGALTHLARVDVRVVVDGLCQDRRETDFFVLQPRIWNDYDVVMYRFGSNPMPGVWPIIDRQMRRLNVTTLSAYTLSHCKHANYQIQGRALVSGQESPDGQRRNYYNRMKKRYLETGDKMELIREYGLHDPSYKKLIRKELQESAAQWIPFSPLSYYIYEEPSLTCYSDAVDICFSPHSIKAMQKWLKTQYTDLRGLNQQWGTHFNNWEEVLPDDTPQAQARGNYASWADHRTFMEIAYAESYRFIREELRKIDPSGLVLNSGTQDSSSHNGCDYSRLNPHTDHLNAYSGGNQFDFHRCFNPQARISSGAGYGVLGKDVFYDFYDQLFKGATGGAYIFWQYSTLNPDLTLCQSALDMEEGFRELRGEGIGKLVGLSRADNHGIAIHYSYPSIHAAWIVDGKMHESVTEHSSQTLDRFNENRDGWAKILKDSGLQFDFIAYADVENDGLLTRGYKTLILPMSVALSGREVEAIREFVRTGGTLIADALPGIMDQHCTFRETGALAEVFGIEAFQGNRELILGMKGNPNLKRTSAVSLTQKEGRPALLSNRFGKGRAYLLNYFLHTYPADKLEGKSEPARKQMGQVLADAEIRPKVRLTSLSGEESVAGVASYVFHDNATRLLGLVPDKHKNGPQKVRRKVRAPGARSESLDIRRTPASLSWVRHRI